jgi:hypothetical protein
MVPYETAEQIRLKKAQYCRFLDTKQWESFEKLALPDARFIFYGVNDEVLHDFASTKALVRLTARMLEDARTSHRVSNSELVQMSESEVHATWAMEDVLVFSPSGNQPGTVVRGYGHYHEVWEKHADDWFLKRLALRLQIRNKSTFGIGEFNADADMGVVD